ncbi:hypothetical protein LOD99_5726 [Oopsacas minuta]|uniref:Uncharacterized protein n=1 Tax=Oopsacas minuta TaxID=111878 RepID=A0AAV7JPY0_9METZ|nr:hypothetical protein LOD99_5726 [Oopsacas minuta]
MVQRKGYEGNGMTDRDEKRYVMNMFLDECKSIYPNEHPIYDGRAIMYTKRQLMGSSPLLKHVVEWRDPEDGRNGVKRKAHVILKPANKLVFYSPG